MGQAAAASAAERRDPGLDGDRALAAAGTNSSPSRWPPASPRRSSRSSPAAASTSTSASPAARLRSRVSTLPRSSVTWRSGRTASSWARRRSALVPTRAPSRTWSRWRSPISTSSASARAGGGDDRGALGQLAGHVLGRVHREVDVPGQQRRLERAGPARLVAARAVDVAGGRDLHELGLAVDRGGDGPRLGERQQAAAGADAQRGQRERRERTSAGAASASAVGSSSPNSSRSSCRRAWRCSASRPFTRAVGSWSRRLTTVRASVSTRSRSASVRPSQRPAFSASSRSTTSSPRARSAASVGQHLELAEPARERLDLLLDDPLRAARLGLAHLHVPGDGALQRVHVEHGDAGQLGALRVDVARHREVDEQQRPPAARGHHLADLLGAEQRVRRGGGGDHDVGPLELAGQRVEGARGAAEALGERDRALAAAVGHEHRGHALVVQRLGGELGGLARADDHDVAVGEVAERVARGVDRDGGDRGAAGRDRGLGAHALAGRQRGAEELVGHRPGGAGARARARTRA